MYDDLPVLQGVLVAESAFTVFAWIGLGTVVYAIWRLVR